MKKIFTHLLAVLMLSLLTTSAWAQETTEVSLNFSDGACNSTTSIYCYSWTSSTTPAITISVGSNKNNLVVSPSSGNFEMHEGADGSTWTFSVNGYRIVSYSFTYKTKQTGNDVTITIGETTYTSSDSEQNLEVTGLDSPTASFSLSGSNTGVIVSNLKLNVYEHSSLTALEEGQVYMFENARAARSLRANGSDDVHVKATDAGDLAQQWYVTKEGDYYVLRNVACGKFLKGALTNGIAWGMTDDYSATENKFELYTSNYETLNALKTNGSDSYGYMHDDTNTDNGGFNVVGWANGNGNTGSHWTITKVDYTTAEITELLEKAPTVAETAAYKTNTRALFTDDACLTPAYGTLAEAQATDYYKNLSTGLKAMVDKIYNGTWAEDNADATKHSSGLDWEAKYAKKFRVQMYEPYSIAGDITSWLGINAHANNDNPTGIYVPEAGNVYVMVEGEIEEGASLRLINGGPNWRITNATSGGFELTTGLNIINFTEAAGMLYICYNVDTYNPDGTTDTERFPYKLSDYEPLKIHIEGGAINGFYNAQGDFRASAQGASDDLWYTMSGASVDCDADWEYMETRANLSVIPVVGHRQVLLFQLEDTDGNKGMKSLLPETVVVPDKPYSRTEKWSDLGVGISDTAPEDYQVNVMMESWDRIMYSELATMGVLSEDDINKMNNLYPRWTSEKEAKEIYDLTNASTLDGKTYLQFCNDVDYSEYFNHHGVALGTESGYMYGGWDHCGYHINTFGSIVSKLSSEAGPTWGPGHEIGHQHQGIFNLNGQTEVTNNMFANIAVWYMGMGTSRYNGSEGSLSSVLGAFNTENNDAYTNNIWALTHMYYRLWLYYHMAGNNTQFMPRLFELCRRERLQNGTVISGDQSMLRFYKHACDAAGEDLTEFFRAHGYLEVMEDRLVGDYTSAVYTQTQEMVDEAIAYVKNKYSKQNYAIILINDGTSETTLQHNGDSVRALWDGYATAELGSVTDFIEGEVSVSDYAATYNSDGTITMTGEGGVGFLVFNEDGELVSFSNKTTFALSDEALETILTGDATFVIVDSEGNTVEAEVDLSAMQKEILGTLIAKAQPIVDKVDDTYKKIGYYKGAAVADLVAALANAKTVYAAASGYEAAYDLLYAELKKVEANPDAKIPFDSSLTYIITNYAYPTRTMTVVDNVVYANTNVDTTTDAAKWQFKETGTPGVYNVYNLSGIYCGTISGSAAVAITSEPDSASNYTVDDLGDGLWAISLNPAGTNTQFHSAANDSYKVVGWNTGGNATKWYLTAVEANSTIADLTNLEVYINKTETLLNEVLGTVTYTRGSNIELQTTTEGSAGYIWSNAPCATEGPIANLVDGVTNNYFHTEWNGDAVTSGSHYIAVDLGSGNTLSRFAFSHTTRSADNDHVKSVDVYGSDDNVTYKYLGSASGMPQTGGTSWQYEGVMVASHRYLRFNMHASRGYWHMAEFDIMPVESYTPTVNDTYSGIVTVEKISAAMDALMDGKSVAFSMSPTTDTVDPALEALTEAYKNLYDEYVAAINARKETLAQLASETNALIGQVGTVQLGSVTPVELTTSNFYCNAPYTTNSNNADYSADYVTYLTDSENNTYLHTRWDANSDDGDYHYLRVDAGEATPIDLFRFTYTTASRSKKDMPLTMVVEGANEIDGVETTKDENFTQIVELTSLPEVLNTNTVYESAVLGTAGTKYRYLRFKVTDITVEESDGNGHPFFTMAEFGISTVVEEFVTVNDTYKSNVTDDLLLASVHTTNSSSAMSTSELVTSVPLLDAQIADQQAAYDKLYAAMNNTAGLKASLKELIDNTQALYDKMATDEGAVDEYYSTSTLTAANLSEALAEIEDAQEVYDNASATKADIETAYNELDEKYTILKGIEDLNVADRNDLTALITTMEDLLAQTTDAGAVETGNIALQVDNEDNPFYIWVDSGSSGVENLIDETDGVANTETYLQTSWGSAVDKYTHYIEVDMGVNNVLENLSLDYITRNSNHANERPTGLKIYGSNNKAEYTLLGTFEENLATDQCQQWTMPEPLELAATYRYIRISVTSDRDDASYHMSDFNLYATSIATVNEFYSTSDIFTCLPAALREYSDAKKAVSAYLIADDFDTAKEQLQEQIDALQAIVNGNVSGRDTLSELATETNTLVTEVAEFDETETELTMQCDDPSAPYYLYCNADGTETNGDGDNVGVAALVGDNKDNTTHLHTTYGNNAQDDDLDHYLRLDMGENEAVMSFKFSYTGRSSSSNNDPSTIVIQGANTLDGVWDVIETLTELPTEGDGVVYNSEVIESAKAYRYIRFMVTATQNGASNNGHPFFVLSKFSVTACKTIEVNSTYASPNLQLSTLVAANNEVVDANAVVNSTTYVTSTAYDTAVDELQAAKDALNLAMSLKDIPVILTTDVNNPVLYKIKVSSNSNVFTYEGEESTSSKKPVLAADELGNRYQAWYFMQGTNSESSEDVLIMPYYNEGAKNTTLRLGFPSTDNNTDIIVVSENTNTTDNWYIIESETDGYWCLQPEGGSTNNAYVNQYGGGSSTRLAFWQSANNLGDDGSKFQFVLDETDYSLSDAYYALLNQYNVYGTPVAGETVGTFTQDGVDAFNAERTTVAALLEAKNSTDDEYNTAREELVAAYEAIEINMPDPTKFYTLRCDYEDRYIYVNDVNKILWTPTFVEKDARFVWIFEDGETEGTYRMKNLQTGDYLPTISGSSITLIEEGVDVTIAKSRNVTGAMEFSTGGDDGLHAHGGASTGDTSDDYVIAHTNTAGANHYFFEEVTPEIKTEIKQSVTLSANNSDGDTKAYSTLYLAYNALIPDGITASIVEDVTDSGQLVLVPVEGGVLEANTAVVLSGNTAGGADFKYTDEESTFDASNNILKGTSYTKLVYCGSDYNIYMLAKKNDRIAFYWTYENRNANGEKETIDGTTNHYKSGYVRCNANKSYLQVEEGNNAAATAAMFSFLMGGNTTDLEGVNAVADVYDTVYDLQGRKLSEITEPGIYIVNGKKVYVK